MTTRQSIPLTSPPNAADSDHSPLLLLEVRGDRTASLCRPISSGRLLIGSEAACELCLRGAGLPALHSIIHADGREVWVEAVMPSPPLRVNGRVTKSIRLQEGDTIEIGAFRILARPPIGGVFHPDVEESGRAPSCEELSAAELVERIEREQEKVAEYEDRRRLGAAALLQAALAYNSPVAADSTRRAA